MRREKNSTMLLTLFAVSLKMFLSLTFSLLCCSWSAESQRCQPCARSTPRSSRPSSSSTQKQSTSSSLRSTKNCSTLTPTLGSWPCPSDCLWSQCKKQHQRRTNKMRRQTRLTRRHQPWRLCPHRGNHIFLSSPSLITSRGVRSYLPGTHSYRQQY